MFSIKRLNELQQVDRDFSAREKALAEARANLADDSAVQSASHSLETLNARLANHTSARRDLEFAVAQFADKLRAVESKLYGGSVTSSRELVSFEEERVILQRNRGAEEEKLLELLVVIEEIQLARDQAQQKLTQLGALREVEKTELLTTEQRLVGELSGLAQTRSEIAAEMPPAVLSTYESLMKTRKGIALAKVERGACQGCRIALSTMQLQRVRTSQGIVQCGSCRRILYLA